MSLRIALRALWRNVLRSSLTMLGVIIGVAAVIAVVAIGDGATRAIKKQIASMGNNMFMIIPGSTSSGAVQFGVGSVQTLSPNDALSIERDCPSCAAVAIIIRARAQLVYMNNNWAPQTVQGCDKKFLDVREWPLEEGECFTDSDVKIAKQVCVIGRTVADQLFPGDEPVGKSVRVKNMPFKIVGVLSKKGANAMGQDQDDVVLMPWTTAKTKIRDHSPFNTVDQLLVTAKSEQLMTSLETEMRETLRANHHCPINAKGTYDDDFTIRNFTEIMNTMASATFTMRIFGFLIALVSLVVGGIGIMNIMLVSVTERTREIGLRMAVGARGFDILSQFLVEAVTLSGIGGVIGIGCGAGVAWFVSYMLHWPIVLSPVAVGAAVGFSGIVGVFFGFYPAWRASRLDPIEALRYE